MMNIVMNKANDNFLRAIQTALDILKPYVDEVIPGSVRWDGEKYSSSKEIRHQDPYALAWWSCLNAIYNLLQHQTEPFSEGQRQYLQSTLFGGMGSFHDFCINEKLYGDEAKEANTRLKAVFQVMYQEFKSLE